MPEYIANFCSSGALAREVTLAEERHAKELKRRKGGNVGFFHAYSA
jgi:hypothetical protein